MFQPVIHKNTEKSNELIFSNMGTSISGSTGIAVIDISGDRRGYGLVEQSSAKENQGNAIYCFAFQKRLFTAT